jgi:hypothetical protein
VIAHGQGTRQHLGTAIGIDHLESFAAEPAGMESGAGADIEDLPRTAAAFRFYI